MTSECVATGEGCIFTKSGPNCELQCRHCGYEMEDERMVWLNNTPPPAPTKPKLGGVCKRAQFWRDQYGCTNKYFEDWMQEEMDKGVEWRAVFDEEYKENDYE